MPAEASEQTWTIKGLIDWATDYLQKYKVNAPRLSADLMLAQVLDLSRLDLYLRFDQPLGKKDLGLFKALLLRRRSQEPLAYILGRREFYGLEFRVGKGVLIPRPETELLVEEGLRALAGLESPRALDMCTGCGAVALALAAKDPRVRVMATDVSEAALAFARANAERLELSGRVTWLLGDMFAPVAAMGGFFDLITANPPYVAEAQWADLPPEVREYEPRQALWGGADGLDMIRQIIAGCGAFLRPQGWLILEMGQGQAETAAALAEDARIFERVSTLPDLSGILRVLSCQRKDYG